LTGLEEPFAKRTVEGDLGMRYSASGILNALSKVELEKANKTYNLVAEVTKRRENVNFIPTTSFDYKVDLFIAETALDVAFSRHVGKTKDVFTHFGTMYYQTGKDLTETKYVIGTGGVLIYNKPQTILTKIKSKPENVLELRPKNPKFLLDSSYILSAMGLLAEVEPKKALRIMKKMLIEVGEDNET
ncbi:MAG: MutL protein, partial [Acholeplasmataceae bacterium]|nr:MutL protein [Acholeplasmataceae bacterium]